VSLTRLNRALSSPSRPLFAATFRAAYRKRGIFYQTKSGFARAQADYKIADKLELQSLINPPQNEG
jgi:hypothetical protein